MSEDALADGQDVTDLMNDYRECVRHIWNAHLRPLDTPESIEDTKDTFDLIAGQLFSAMVVTPLSRDTASAPRCGSVTQPFAQQLAPLLFLQITPFSDRAPIMINRDAGFGGYWDHPVSKVDRTAVLHFVDYFDFDVYGYRSFDYYLVRIASIEGYSEVTNRYALVRTEHTRVLYVDFSKEDRELAEAGMEDYSRALAAEDIL